MSDVARASNEDGQTAAKGAADATRPASADLELAHERPGRLPDRRQPGSVADPRAILALQRFAGNRAVARAVAVGAPNEAVSPLALQREVVHWTLRSGKKIDQKAAHRIIGLLAKSDAKTLKSLPDRQGRGKLGSFEFGLGRNDQGDYCIVEGSGKSVNWSEDGTTKGLVPVAHSHPIEGRAFGATYDLTDLMAAAGGDDLAVARQLILPSIDDVKVANQLKKSQPTHHVYTPYRVKKQKKKWVVDSSKKGAALTFRISQMRSFIVKKGTDRYLTAELTAMAGSKDILTVETWCMNFGKTDRAVGFTKPSAELEPW
jgi:hypothetical protein